MNIMIGLVIALVVVCGLGLLVCTLMIGSLEDDKMKEDLKKKRSKHDNRK